MNRAGSAINVGTGLIDEFKAFLFRGNVVDLAVAVVIGAAFNAVVQAMVDDIIMPIIGLFGGAPDFSTNKFTLRGSDFYWGDFVNQLISFLLIAGVIYFLVVKPMNLMMSRVRVTKETTEVTATVTETVVKDDQS